MNCLRCTHKAERHCPGGVVHANHKEEARMMSVASRRAASKCATRHCLEPLCSCVDLIAGEPESRAA